MGWVRCPKPEVVDPCLPITCDMVMLSRGT
jgi:hypothetical protein